MLELKGWVGGQAGGYAEMVGMYSPFAHSLLCDIAIDAVPKSKNAQDVWDRGVREEARQVRQVRQALSLKRDRLESHAIAASVWESSLYTLFSCTINLLYTLQYSLGRTACRLGIQCTAQWRVEQPVLDHLRNHTVLCFGSDPRAAISVWSVTRLGY